MTEAGVYHVPVLGPEVMELLDPAGPGLWMDGTVGGGGHALLLLERCPGCRLLAVDRDPEALDRAREVLADHLERVRFLQARFDRASDDPEVRSEGLAGVVLDLGVSSWQIDREERGFTFARGAPLDMRMSGPSGSGPTAADLLNQAPVEELERIFGEYGEERRAGALAREVAKRRSTEPFRTSDPLVAALSVVRGRPPSARDKARIFQALRIAVNRELESLEEGLPALRDALLDGGVLAVISYHSLEDRIVKRAFREWSRSCVCPPRIPVCRCRGRALGTTLTSSPVRPSEAEIRRNPRARSAKLRAWRRAA